MRIVGRLRMAISGLSGADGEIPTRFFSYVRARSASYNLSEIEDLK